MGKGAPLQKHGAHCLKRCGSVIIFPDVDEIVSYLGAFSNAKIFLRSYFDAYYGNDLCFNFNTRIGICPILAGIVHIAFPWMIQF